ncbi:hypothetical protein V1511DRAFT_497919 [Dipodascopsis uninucleata]
MDMIEFKAFPSGLHSSKRDVIYFVQGEHYVGTSVFIRIDTNDETERFAKMYSLGVLVPVAGRLSFRGPSVGGRLGRGWAHVDGLRTLLEEYVHDPSDFSPLEAYYSDYGLSVSSITPASSASINQAEYAVYNPPRRPFELNMSKLTGYSAPPSGLQSQSQLDNDTDSLAASAVGAGSSNLVLPRFHPAHSIPLFLDILGPLVWKVWKAALARERILIVGDIPIEQGCNMVYGLSLLANIPGSIGELLPIPAFRVRPLFSVGTYDIDYLKTLNVLSPAEEAHSRRPSPFYGWIAYTTDKILEEKDGLFDLVVRLPPSTAIVHAAASVAHAVNLSPESHPESPSASALGNDERIPITNNIYNARILYPTVFYADHPKVRLKASLRDMRRFQALQAQIGNSIDPRHRWYRRYCVIKDNEHNNELNLQRRVTGASSGSGSSLSSRQINATRMDQETLALLSAEEEAAAEDDAIYNDDPELFFSTKTDLQTEQPSWKQLTWLGFLWWASAGELARVDEDIAIDSLVIKSLENNVTTTSLAGQSIARGTKPLLLDDSISRASSIAPTPIAVSNEESFTYLSPFQDLEQLDNAIRRGQNVNGNTNDFVENVNALRKTEDGNESDEIITSDENNLLNADLQTSTTRQVAIIAFFHRFTARIFLELSRMIKEQNLVVVKINPKSPRRRRRSRKPEDLTPAVVAATEAAEAEAVNAPSQPMLSSVPSIDQDATTVDIQNADITTMTDNMSLSNIPRQTLWISKIDMIAMGLDPWSESDSKFISKVVECWWGGQIEIQRDNEFLNSITFCC